ncbi:MAG TPA: type II toxin-antitoxin system VapC family toxin [Leptolyngbya sp.]|jgi:predicted nucleic acid-binding protein|nr:type II toxin-antitoxin system VapC family toxin [Leptolyngbya sp.]
MTLLDSNIIIYAIQPENAQLRQFIADHSSAVSALSDVEVLGYHRLNEPDRSDLEQFFQIAQVLPISQPVLEQAIAVRQIRRMSLGDSIIAGTALVHHLTLVTRNTDDFQWIEQIRLFNPFSVDSDESC